MVKIKILFLFLIIALVVLTGCAKSVSELTADDNYVDKTVSVKGTVEGVTKIGILSGYTLVDSDGDAIIIASDDLPSKGDKMTAKGVLKKGPFGLGYFIDTNN